MQMNIELLGNSAVSDARHTCQSHTDKRSCRVCWQFFFPLIWCSETSCLTEIIMWRQHTRFASPACSKHQMFFLTFWAELLRHSEQVSVPPRAKGQIQRKKLHHNQPLQTFHPAPKAVTPSAVDMHSQKSFLDFKSYFTFRWSDLVVKCL